MSVTAEPTWTARISDPMPARCSRCLRSAGDDIRFVDFRSAFDAGSIVEPGSMMIRASLDELHLCEPCVKEGAEVLGYKPELHVKQLREVRKLELERDHWRETARRTKDELNRQLDSGLGEPPRRRR